MAKNLTQFAPGMQSPTSLGESGYCALVFGAGGRNDGTWGNIRNYGGHGLQWEVPTGVTEARFYVTGQGSGGGGVNCCGYGPGGNGGGSAVIAVAVEGGNEWCFCMAARASCAQGNAGEIGCRLYVYDKTASQLYFETSVTPSQCACCNYYVNNNCETVCFTTTAETSCWEAENSCLGLSRYGCKEAYIASPFYKLADSDVNMFKTRPGYTISTCCYSAAAHCGMSTFSPRQHFKTDKSHYVGTSITQAENNTGATHRTQFASMHSYASTSYGLGGICEMGGMGLSAIANGGNCYCGSTGPNSFVTILYK
jgi:hypothetical protein